MEDEREEVWVDLSAMPPTLINRFTIGIDGSSGLILLALGNMLGHPGVAEPQGTIHAQGNYVIGTRAAADLASNLKEALEIIERTMASERGTDVSDDSE